jgi:hypothetical protein
MPYVEIKDALGVSGEVLSVELTDRNKIILEVREIISRNEVQGYKKLDDIPEGAEKQRLRDLLRALGLEVKF